MNDKILRAFCNHLISLLFDFRIFAYYIKRPHNFQKCFISKVYFLIKRRGYLIDIDHFCFVNNFCEMKLITYSLAVFLFLSNFDMILSLAPVNFPAAATTTNNPTTTTTSAASLTPSQTGLAPIKFPKK